MRLDKYLKVSRIIKRRTVAHEASENSRVLVNNKVAKPSTDIKVGDIITINYYKKKMVVKVNSITPIIKKDEATEMYEILEITENEGENNGN